MLDGQKKKTDQVAPYSHEPQDTILKSLSLTDVGYKSIAQQSFQELIKIAGDQSNQWMSVSERGEEKKVVDLFHRVTINYRNDTAQDKDLVIVRITAPMPYSIDEVTPLLLDLKKRKEWDVKFHRGKRVAKLDNTSDVAHLVFKSFSSPYKYRDFCILRSWSKLEKGGTILAARSILHPNAPEQKDNVRAVLFPSGYIVSPLDNSMIEDKSSSSPSSSSHPPSSGCTVTFIAQMDRESVLIISPDLLGESNELRQSFNNIRMYLQQQHKQRTVKP